MNNSSLHVTEKRSKLNFFYYYKLLFIAAKVSNKFSRKTLLSPKVIWMTPLLKLMKDKISTYDKIVVLKAKDMQWKTLTSRLTSH